MITKEAKNTTRFVESIYFTPSARSGFESFLRWVRESRGGDVLLPAYIGETDKEGSGVMDPVRSAGLGYGFYPVDWSLQPDMKQINELLVTGKFSVLLIIHYFGFWQCDIVRVRSWCDQLGVLLVEDCAHSLLSEYGGSKLGTFGHGAFHSLHKLTSAAEGGMFRVENGVPFAVPESITEQLSILALQQYVRTDLKETARIRRKNYQYYLTHLRKLKGIDWMFPSLPAGVIPLNFPILIQQGLREEFYFGLIEKGVTVVSLYYRMIQEINRDSFPVSYEISDAILNLPTHQDITQEDLDQVIAAVVSVHKTVMGG